jgi:seryl-tRNA synthetase
MSVLRSFNLKRAGDVGVPAILHGLSVSREDVLACRFDEATRMLEIEAVDAAAADRSAQFVEGMIQTHRLISRRIVRENHARALRIHDTDALLVGCPDVQVLGRGLTGLNGDLLRLFRFFEREFQELAAGFGAEENQYPAMIPAEILAEVGYFHHFPQHVTFCSRLPDSLPVLESVSRSVEANGGALTGEVSDLLADPEHALTPGVCLPCYRQLRDAVLEAGEVRTLTMQNHVFRYEGTRFRPLARGWDFTVRDIVFFGDYEAMQRLRNEVMDRTLELCRELDLEVTVELANDPFFLDASRDKALAQRMGEVKYELLFPLPWRGESLAAASFNLHRNFYTSVYNTRQGDRLAESSCMGFGLDRWLYGFLSQKGLDPAGWGERVTSRFGRIP